MKVTIKRSLLKQVVRQVLKEAVSQPLHVSPDAVYQRIPKAITELRENYAMFIFTDNGLKPPPEFFKDDRSFMKYIKLGENIDVNKYPWADEVGPIEFFLQDGMLCVEGMIGGGNWYVWTKDGWYPEDEYENPVKFKTPNL